MILAVGQAIDPLDSGVFVIDNGCSRAGLALRE